MSSRIGWVRVVLFHLGILLGAAVWTGEAGAQFVTDIGNGAGSSRATVLGDFNEDGRLDAAHLESNSGGRLTIRPGRGDGRFANATESLLVGPGEFSIAADDFDTDGHLDLATTDVLDGFVTIFLGDGEGRMTQSAVLEAGPVPLAGPRSIVAGDVNEDGLPDLVVANGLSTTVRPLPAPGTVMVFLGDGGGSFGVPTILPAGDGAMEVGLADFDQDGSLDVVALLAGVPVTVRLWLGDGTGAFGAFADTASGLLGDVIWHMLVHDLTDDGNPDVAVYSLPGEITAALYVGDGMGAFDARVLPAYENGYRGFAVAADFNEDGTLDLVNDPSGTLQVGLGLGDGTFPEHESYYSHDSPRFFSPQSFAAGDMNGDGHLDVVHPTKSGLNVYLGNGDGTFQAHKRFSAPRTGGERRLRLRLGHVDHDGLLDVATPVSVSLGLPGGEFSEPLRLAFPSQGPADVELADFDGDGNLDVARVFHFRAVASVELGVGDGTFGPITEFPVGLFPESITSADFDGDGDFDLAVANGGSDDVSILLGAGDGSFPVEVRVPVGLAPAFITSADLTADGLADLAVANRDSEDITIIRSDGGGLFSQADLLDALRGPPTVLRTADMDNDGFTDLLWVTGVPTFGSINLATGDASGMLETALSFDFRFGGDIPHSFAIGDIDRDGRLDMVAATGVYLPFLGAPGPDLVLGPRPPNGVLDATVSFRGTNDAALADLDGDGRLDLVVVADGSISVALGNWRPEADAGGDQVVEQTSPVGADVVLDGTNSSDVDGDVLSYMWDLDDDGKFDDSTDSIMVRSFPAGESRVDLLVRDTLQYSYLSRAVITVQDTTPPSVDAGADRTVITADPAGATLDLSPGVAVSDVADPNPAIAFEIGGSPVPMPHLFPVGTTVVLVKAIDASSNAGQDELAVAVSLDEEPPVLTVELTPSVLWPPNHKLVEISPTITLTDNEDPAPGLELVSITSNEPDDGGQDVAWSPENPEGLGDGNTVGDIQVVDDQVFLRAERAGTGEGRVYTLTYQATDRAGNVTTMETLVRVPVSQSQ